MGYVLYRQVYTHISQKPGSLEFCKVSWKGPQRMVSTPLPRVTNSRPSEVREISKMLTGNRWLRGRLWRMAGFEGGSFSAPSYHCYCEYRPWAARFLDFFFFLLDRDWPQARPRKAFYHFSHTHLPALDFLKEVGNLIFRGKLYIPKLFYLKTEKWN